jgi:hypothetical protein
MSVAYGGWNIGLGFVNPQAPAAQPPITQLQLAILQYLATPPIEVNPPGYSVQDSDAYMHNNGYTYPHPMTHHVYNVGGQVITQ